VPRSPPSPATPGRASSTRAIWDDQLGCWASDAEVAETGCTAFTSKKDQQVTARLVVRHVRDLNKKAAQGQDEQAFADWYDGLVAHLPSGSFNANAAWLVIAAVAQNLVRAAGTLPGPLHARARAATIHRDLNAVAGRAARHGRGHLILHLPEYWREDEWLSLWHAACGPPAPAA
jgi:hypothetical protein